MRTSTIKRETAETRIELTLCLDGKGNASIQTGCGFLDHMLTLFSKHAGFDLELRCQGDVEVDFHHTVEDVGIVLGQAFAQALGEKKGILRYGDTTLPMDEALILSAVDLSGRAYLAYDLPMRAKKVGDFDTELGEEFFLAFVRNAACTLHLRELAGKNAHHILEGAFKSVAHSLKKAVRIDPALAGEVLSTKGSLV